eukprot:977103-Alexandrium_andersonii.AAC.1
MVTLTGSRARDSSEVGPRLGEGLRGGAQLGDGPPCTWGQVDVVQRYQWVEVETAGPGIVVSGCAVSPGQGM